MKQLSILVTAILLSYSSFSQDYKFELGLQGGPNISAMRYASSFLTSNRYGQIAGMAGLFVQYNISTVFALRIDPAFERLANNSGNLSFSDPSGNIIEKGIIHFHYDYLTVPILVRAGIGKKINYFLNLGPSFGFLLSQKNIYDVPNDKSTKENKDQYQTFNFGIVTGVGAALPINEKFSLSFELRNNFGLSNIYASSNSNSGVKTNSTSFLVGFAYKLGNGNKVSKVKFTPAF